MRMVVVLPAPFGPRKPKTSPFSTEKFEIAHGGEVAVFLAELVKRDHLMHGPERMLTQMEAVARERASQHSK